MNEEISDLISDEAYVDRNFKKGLALKFAQATIVVTKVDRKNKRTWGRHTELVKKSMAREHIGHDVDTLDETISIHKAPFCNDCISPISQPNNIIGRMKAKKREETTLDDGTIIDTQEG